ncbi:NADH:ubiquinone reductase (Na(+)-transporting) subunit C [Porphyromonas pogonae]|uniref:NADH:ubiquinone reductase (Na(+)-transporting) subunit C n=1 Tax=Porphyromonas pogonae TaxID=867595 RepID=UPI002E76AFF4|nr:NADH:ubiquinone reductase (Na(+)-transporting) subunit C [Porphyromonas pogonae]
MNRDKNSYTIIYASVMVIIVAVLLAFTSTALKSRQQSNEQIDKMQQMLRSINSDTPNKADVKTNYRKLIKKELLITNDGSVVKEFTGDQIGNNEAFSMSTDLEFKKILHAEEFKQDYKYQLPVYVAEMDGKEYYILPLNGNGLWDKIWGFLSLDATDCSTVFGGDFGNKGETPGLGAEISKKDFSDRFKGKHIFMDNQFKSIAVVKPGKKADGQDYVDGISGGTLTSNGVDKMLQTSLKPYVEFLNKNKK